MSSLARQVNLLALINAHERQREYLRAIRTHDFILYGGARGGGKSYIGRWGVVRFLLDLTRQGIRRSRAGIFCISYPELNLRQWDPAKDEFPAWLGTFNESKREFRFRDQYGGHVISFLNLDKPDKYKGAEFAIVFVDELTLCADRKILSTFIGCLRSKGVKRCVFTAATNPDGPGHSWVKRLWITQDFSSPDDARLRKDSFLFVRALPTDNPHLSIEYIENNLAGLPPSLRKPWLEGSWDLFEGQRFELNPKVHVLRGTRKYDVLERFKTEPVKFYRSIDYGFDAPYACSWFAVLPGKRPDVFLFREDQVRGLKSSGQIKRIQDLTHERIETSYLDSACWAEQDDGLSIAQRFFDGKLPVTQVQKDRATGWVAVENLLDYEVEDGNPSNVIRQPRLQIFEECTTSIQMLTDILWDPEKPGDVQDKKTSEHHWDLLQTIRYFALTHFGKPEIEKPIPPDSMEYLNALAADQYGKKAKIW